MEEEFITRKPSRLILHKTISYYYFHKTPSSSESKRFVYYPNFKNALTIYKNSNIEFSRNHSKSTPDKQVNFRFIYSGIQNQFRTAEIISPFDKIGIVFQELGINHFIKVPLSSINNHPIDKSFDYFGEDFNRLFESVYNEKSIDVKVKLMDDFFISKQIDFQENKLTECVEKIINSDKKINVIELSNLCNIHTKTVLRMFKKHLCCTTKDYIDIVQFRRTLNDYILVNQNLSLTKTAFDNQYYDQAQFINHVKKLTGKNPKSFFKNVKHLGEEDTFWTIQ